MSACGPNGGDDGEPDDAGQPADSGQGAVDFVQPVGGLIVAGAQPDGAVNALYVLEGADTPDSFAVAAGSGTTDPGRVLRIDEIRTPAVAPFETMVVSVEGLAGTDSAISLVFEGSGVQPVAVPVVALDDSTVRAAAPLLLTRDGTPTAGSVMVRLAQAGEWGHAYSAQAGPVDIAAPYQPSANLPAGTVFASYLQGSITILELAIEEGDSDLPPEFVRSVEKLRLGLIALRDATEAVLNDPTARPVLETSGEGPLEAITLDEETLSIADRIVASWLLAEAEVGLLKQVADPCAVRFTEEDERLRQAMCDQQQRGERTVRYGSAGVRLGFELEVSVFLGLYGGVVGTLLQGSRKAEVAFELGWAALSGHLAAWVAGRPQPTTGETMADVGATLVDGAAGTRPVLATTIQALRFGREYDRLIRAARAEVDPPDAGTDAGEEHDAGDDVGDVDEPDVGDDAGDTDDDSGTPGGTRYEGEASLYGDEMPWPVEADQGCVGVPRVDLIVTVTGFDGDGTPGRPYLGNVTVSGTLVVLSSGRCAGSAAIGSVNGRIGGLEGVVGFDLESAAPPRYQVTMTNGLVERPTRTLTGDIVVEFWPQGRFLFGVDGVIELSEVD